MQRTFKAAVMLVAALISFHAQACTAIARSYRHDWYSARTFDWSDGRIVAVLNRKGARHTAHGLPAGVAPLHWRARYNSLTLDMDSHGQPNRAAVVDGMNQQGLSVAVLELDAARYPAVAKGRPAIGSSQVAQYWLDRYATVKQVVADVPSLALTASLYQGQRVPLHFVVDDASGDHAVIEYLSGHLRIFQASSCPLNVLTNTAYAGALQQWRDYQQGAVRQQSLSGYGSMARFFKTARFVQQAVSPKTQQQQINFMWAGLSIAMEPLQSPWPTQWSVVRNNTARQYCFRSRESRRSRCYGLSQVNFSQASVSFKRWA